jgi:hypothetical protein
MSDLRISVWVHGPTTTTLPLLTRARQKHKTSRGFVTTSVRQLIYIIHGRIGLDPPICLLASIA